MSHKKFGPDRFSRFDVYWIQTNKQTNKQTDKQAKFIYRLNLHFIFKISFHQNDNFVLNMIRSSSLQFFVIIYKIKYSSFNFIFFRDNLAVKNGVLNFLQ